MSEEENTRCDMIDVNKIYEGDALSILKTFPEKIFNTCVTSPPYYGLRAYGTNPVIWDGDENCKHEFTDEVKKGTTGGPCILKGAGKAMTEARYTPNTKFGFCVKCGAWRGELGSEPSPELFVKHIVDIFREVKRTLMDDGTLWCNLGDSYWGSGKGIGSNHGKAVYTDENVSKIDYDKNLNLKPKDLIGIPWMVAFALRADGWYLRQDIIWSKPNPMPESVIDRCTKAHEYIFHLSKSSKYYYDAKAIATPYKDKTYTTFGCEAKGNGDGSGLIKSENWGNDVKVRKPKQWKTPDGWDTGEGSHGTIHREGREKGKIGYTPKRNPRPGIDINGGNQGKGGIPIKGYEHRGTGDKTLTGHSGNFDSNGDLIGDGLANKKSVWTVGTQSFSEAHFATFPEKLIVDCIKAGCPEGGTVLDPFGGANTTGLVSRKLNRNYVAIELNPAYIKIGEKRVYNEIGLFL